MNLYDKDGKPLKIGDPITTTDGKRGILESMSEPDRVFPLGGVRVKLDNHLATIDFYPTAINATFK